MKQLETDVAVIAAGVAGMASAVAAAEKGAKVIVFEKTALTGGTGNKGTGPFAVESKLQQKKNVALTIEKAFKIFMDYTHWRVDARLVRDYFYKSADTLDWLEKMGVVFDDVMPYIMGSCPTWHGVAGPSGHFQGGKSTATMMNCLTKRAKELGVQILLETPAKKILKEKDRIVGLVAEDKSEQTVQASAKAVIVATGGFSANAEMVKKYTGYELGRDIFPMAGPDMLGEGIRMAWNVGAGEGEMSMEIIASIPGPVTSGSSLTTPALAVFRPPHLIVNLLGERFVNEEIKRNPTFFGNAISRQRNRCAFAIFDGATKEFYEAGGLEFHGPMALPIKIDNLDADFKKTIDAGHTNIFVADTLDELAYKTGINIDGLKKTIEGYNEACETGHDELFSKNYKYLRPVKQPKFYCAKYFPGAYGSLGGIKTNYKLEVLTKDFDVIPGLYAAGIDANSIYGDSYVFTLPGNTMGFALNSGRIAGENASEYVKSAGK